MKYNKIIAFVFILIMLAPISSQAKWWIFGQSEDEISIDYLYLNKTSFEESREEITIYKDSLQDGLIHIRGKASVKTGTIADVRISTDGKETWKSADLSKDGAFSYNFRPESGKTYVIYVEITDTRAKTNDVESTRKEVALSDENITQVIRDALDAMIQAYRNKDARAFMSYVSSDFAGDETILDRAIRRDFSSLVNIDLRYTLGTVSTDSKGMLYATLTYNRFVISSRDGKSYSDRGITEFVFQRGPDHPLVYSMKNPLIFGLSNAEEVATGTINTASNDPIIVIDERGNVEELPFDQAIKRINGEEDTSYNVEFGNNLVLISQGHPPAGFDFAAGEVTSGSGDFIITGGTSPYAYGFLEGGALINDMGMVFLNDVTEVPATGYTAGPSNTIELYEDHVYAFKLAGNTYGLIYVRTVSSTMSPSGPTIRMVFDYKYRSDGLRNF